MTLSPSSAAYQPHIDGLRAIAVLSVLCYHLEISYFPVGFVGVDVFFVISGFLITRLIVRKLDHTGGFSFRGFYLRRARRLLPAMFATLGAAFIAGFFLFSPFAFYNFSKEILASILSFANILFWHQAGYFDANETRCLWRIFDPKT